MAVTVACNAQMHSIKVTPRFSFFNIPSLPNSPPQYFLGYTMNSLAARRNIDLNLGPSSTNYVDSGCDLELSLSTPGSFGSADARSSTVGRTNKDESRGDHEHCKQMWIVYNGNVCVCEATEVQARAILSQAAAAREAEERRRSSSPQPVSPSLPPQLQRSTGIAMKRSLQRFLEKRRVRIQSIKSPYQKQSSTTECQ